MMRLVWTEPAVADLQAIVDFIGRDSEVYAATVAERLFQGVEALERFPRMGKVVREVRRPSIREIVVEPILFDRLSGKVREGLAEAAQAFGAFIGRPARLAGPEVPHPRTASRSR